jgi:ribosomal protein L11 methyltransferase
MHALTVLVPAASVEAVSDLLGDECAALSVSVEDADAGTAMEQPVFDEPGLAPSGRWRAARIAALFADEFSAVAAAAGLIATGIGDGSLVEAITPIEDCDWVRLTQSQFASIEIESGFWIVPTWASVPHAASKVIRLDPGMAFGTGTHPTTRMCLRWIARSASRRDSPWARVLDYGCGSGVLAIAAGLFGADAVEAVDIDRGAVEATRVNAEANGVRVRADPPESVSGRYSLIVANILSAPLKLLAPLLATHLAEGAELVLSGILERQADELRDAYAPWLALHVAEAEDGWILMTGDRRAADGKPRGMISR